MAQPTEFVGVKMPATTRAVLQAAACESGRTLSAWLRAVARRAALEELSATTDDEAEA